jgi:hypothetical protein
MCKIRGKTTRVFGPILKGFLGLGKTTPLGLCPEKQFKIKTYKMIKFYTFFRYFTLQKI